MNRRQQLNHHTKEMWGNFEAYMCLAIAHAGQPMEAVWAVQMDDHRRTVREHASEIKRLEAELEADSVSRVIGRFNDVIGRFNGVI